jgi:S-formylglutathione hydrolase FrmB
MKNKLKRTLVFVLAVTSTFHTNAQNTPGITIIDSKHYSNVFGEIRNYRIFLPPLYFDNAEKKYPVIYFLHGWSQRYFGDGGQEYAEFDKGNDNNGDNIANFVTAHDVIVVKSDGYNRSPDEKYYLRPYNIGPVETFRQFPIYYPELINYIDTHYRTIADREHRAISGLSMGGFMAFWIGGKYPDLFSAAGNFCGSAEFVVGPKNFPVEYKHIEMYKNYEGMNVRLNYGDKDFIRAYHQDINRIWPQVMDNYEYKIYHAEHSTCGLNEMFEFFMNTFEHPPVKPQGWDHTDVYPEFSVWGYHISSDRNLPGFTILENVDRNGFRCSVREFVPDGELMPFVNLSITTPAVYKKNSLYVINDIDTRNFEASRKIIKSDSTGRLQISINGSGHEIGITKEEDKQKPNICIAKVEIDNTQWATHKKDIDVSIKLLNKGFSEAKNLTAKLSAIRSNAVVKQGESKFGNIAMNELKSCEIPFSFRVENDSIEIEKFKLTIQDDNKNKWIDFFEIPLKKDVPEIKDFEIADGKIFTVAKGGTDVETIFLGSGNGDGIANPGESLVILVKDKNKYWRTDLTVADKYVNPFGMNTRRSDDWTPFDHVGASAKYSVPLIASDCPENHTIDFFAEYWLPEYPFHIIKQGIIKIEVKGKDNTPPNISGVQVSEDNIIHTKIYDGSKIQSVKATFILKDDPSKIFEVELTDDGMEGDNVAGDNVFSKKIPEQKFGIYRVILEATDSFRNKITQEVPEIFVVH